MSFKDNSVFCEKFVRNSYEAIFFTDSQGRILLWNKGCEKLFGYGQEDIPDGAVFSVFDGREREKLRTIFDSLRRDTSVPFETTLVSNQKKVFDVDITSSLMEKSTESSLTFFFQVRNVQDKDTVSLGFRARHAINFIIHSLSELRRVNLDDKLDVKPFVKFLLRDIKDQVSLNPTHIFVAMENEERLLEGEIYLQKSGEIRTIKEKLVFHPDELKEILPGQGDLKFANWFEITPFKERFHSLFNPRLAQFISDIENYISYSISGEKEGLIIAFNYPGQVTNLDAELIKGLGEIVGTLFSFQYIYRDKDNYQLAFISKIVEIVEARENATDKNRVHRIKNYARIIADELSKHPKYKGIIDRELVRMIYFSASLYDIGKIVVPEKILQKPGRLDDREYQMMREHTVHGGKILEGPKFLQIARDIAYYHHEKFDGTGYPYGKKGEEIPLWARIVCLADVYDAMTSKKSYKEAFSHDRTKKLIEIMKGSHFDPDIVDAFFKREDDFVRIKEMYQA